MFSQSREKISDKGQLNCGISSLSSRISIQGFDDLILIPENIVAFVKEFVAN